MGASGADKLFGIAEPDSVSQPSTVAEPQRIAIAKPIGLPQSERHDPSLPDEKSPDA